MHIADAAATPRRRAPLPDGPTVAPLVPPGVSDRAAVVHMELPAGAGLPEHAHGASEIVLIPLSGAVEVRQGEEVRALSAGAVARIAVGERVSLANTGAETASLMVVASPPDFAEHLASWPEA